MTASETVPPLNAKLLADGDTLEALYNFGEDPKVRECWFIEDNVVVTPDCQWLLERFGYHEGDPHYIEDLSAEEVCERAIVEYRRLRDSGVGNIVSYGLEANSVGNAIYSIRPFRSPLRCSLRDFGKYIAGPSSDYLLAPETLFPDEELDGSYFLREAYDVSHYSQLVANGRPYLRKINPLLTQRAEDIAESIYSLAGLACMGNPDSPQTKSERSI